MANPDLGIADIEGPDEIGRGGFGVVYRARQAKLDRTVAVKVIEQAVDEASRERFEQEGRALGSLSGHPNIVVIYDSGFTPRGYPYLVLEYLPDGSLADVVARRGPLGVDEATDLTIQIAGALETVHRAGVLHRDIKPENILLGAYGEPKLGDFGIARIQDRATMTGTGTIWGSPAHAAPEVIEGRGASVRSDVYSLASTLYVLLSGTTAFQRDTDESIIPVLHRVTTQPPPDLRASGVPEALWDVLDQGMAKDPDRRPPTAAAFGDVLNVARSQLGLPSVPMRIRGTAPSSATVVTPSVAPSAGAAPAPHPTPSPLPVTQGPATVPPPAGAEPAWAATAAPSQAAWTATPPPTPSTTGPGAPHGTAPLAPSTPPGRKPVTAWVIGACAVVIVAALVAGSIVIATRSSPSAVSTSDTTGAASSSGPSSASSASSATSSTVPVQLADTLIRPAGLPGDWRVDTSDDVFAGLTDFKPCGQEPDGSAVVATEHQVLAGEHNGKPTQILQLVIEFETEEAAEAFVASLPELNGCGTWTDDDGIPNTVEPVELGTTWGDQTLAFLNGGSVFQNGTYLDVEIEYVVFRSGRYVVLVGNGGEEPVDRQVTETAATEAHDLLTSAGG